MNFGRIDIDQAEGAILAHSLHSKGGILKKGRVLSAADVDALRAAGHESVVAARLGEADVPEDDAAAVVARAIAGTCVRVAEPFTGRCNLYAEVAGIVTIDAGVLTRINRIDEALTIATVMPFDRVSAGQMLATVKVIPFAAPEPTVAKAVALAEGGLVSVAPFKAKRVGLVLTTLPNTKASVLAKRERVMADRLAALGSELTSVLRVAHDPEAVRSGIEALKGEGLDPILVFAASAIVDRNDVIPAAVAAAGGEILHLGMPVDPGNLLMLGRIGRTDVVGVPSCAGSPKLNGFDWVLERRLAGLPVGREEIAGMGVGGLLKEIATRPQPRDIEDDSARREKRIGIVILAAGRSSRMGARNKLTEEIEGRPIVYRVAQAALESRARPIVVVTGHQADDVKSRLNGLDVKVVHNPDYAEGMSTSLRAGISALPNGLDGAIVALGDMPEVQAAHFDRLIAAFEPKEGRSIVVPVFHGRRGNPVLWGAEHFPAMMAVEGDVGARQVLAENAESIVELDLKSNAVLIDVDTPEALAAVRQGRSQG